MAQQLAYVIVTPYTLAKSRTGGILARLISRTGLELVAARLFGPRQELVEEYSKVVISAADPQDRSVQQLIHDYIVRELGPDPKSGRRRRCMLLLFKGEDAVRKIRAVVGNISHTSRTGETIRDTFGDYVLDERGQVRYFEPAVLAAPNADEANQKLKLWARYSDADGGILDDCVEHPTDVPVERTLVLIKPDNFRFPTGRPGNVIDFFSRTGLYIVGIRVLHMSTAQAMEFYGPVKDFLRTKLKGVIAAKAKAVLEKDPSIGFTIPPEAEAKLADILGPVFGDNQFDNIVRFMCGRSESECPPDQLTEPGSEKCIALVYEGQNAVAKIRDVLGPTDPAKAPPGSIRREFGSNIMVNAAHASDAPESARRELGIVKVEANDFKRVVEQFCGSL
ncbi:MAG: hypothetical protein RLZZ265_590 [Verrucomicrobiota bacterium]|jgi:nucleoside diphosphate kinase